ncbi:MAG: hypothetical protein OZ922_09160 [Myxococcales bacterium]|jgi:hypothetical protein|nr:hypothetical protein [Myxococcales bacterium]
MKNRLRLFGGLLSFSVLLLALLCPLPWAPPVAAEGPPMVIDGISPRRVGNNGFLWLSIIGKLPSNITRISLRSEGLDEIVGDLSTLGRTVFEDEFGEPTVLLRVRFELVDAVPSTYRLQIEDGDDPGRQTERMDLVVEELRPSSLWVGVSGLDRVRPGSIATYALTYGADGNTDISSGLLFLALPKGPAITYQFDFDLADFQSSAGTTGKFEAIIGDSPYEVFRLHIKDISPSGSAPLTFTINWGSEQRWHNIEAWFAGSRPEGFYPIWPTNHYEEN